MGRSAFPSDDVTAGEWLYLEERYSASEAADRCERLEFMLRRLVRRGLLAEPLHRALMLGIDRWDAHQRHQMTRDQARRRNAAIARARKQMDRALASLRKLLPKKRFPDDEDMRVPDDDVLFQLRDRLLTPIAVAPPTRPRGGRPSEWRQVTDKALRELGVFAAERRELITALGFAKDE